MSNQSKAYFLPLTGVSSEGVGPIIGLGYNVVAPFLSFTVAAGAAQDEATGQPMRLRAGQLVNMAGNGANGLDVGAITQLKAYFVYLIKNPTTGDVACIVSLSSTLGGVTLPAGYTLGRRIGSLRTKAAAAELLPFVQETAGSTRRYLYTLADAARALTAPDASAAIVALPLAEEDAQAAGTAAAIPSTATSVRVDVSVLTTGGTASPTAVQFASSTSTSTLGSGTIGITSDDITAVITKNVQMELPVVAGAIGIRTNDAQTLPSLIINGYSEQV